MLFEKCTVNKSICGCSLRVGSYLTGYVILLWSLIWTAISADKLFNYLELSWGYDDKSKVILWICFILDLVNIIACFILFIGLHYKNFKKLYLFIIIHLLYCTIEIIISIMEMMEEKLSTLHMILRVIARILSLTCSLYGVVLVNSYGLFLKHIRLVEQMENSSL